VAKFYTNLALNEFFPESSFILIVFWVGSDRIPLCSDTEVGFELIRLFEAAPY
jgi:hypothetical protein